MTAQTWGVRERTGVPEQFLNSNLHPSQECYSSMQGAQGGPSSTLCVHVRPWIWSSWRELLLKDPRDVGIGSRGLGWRFGFGNLYRKTESQPKLWACVTLPRGRKKGRGLSASLSPTRHGSGRGVSLQRRHRRSSPTPPPERKERVCDQRHHVSRRDV